MSLGVFFCAQVGGWREEEGRKKKVRKEMLREHAKDNPGCEKRE